MLCQRTLKSVVHAVGVGVHSGQKVRLTLRPAAADAGITFRRVDLPEPVDIRVDAQAVCDTRMASTISAGGDPKAPKVQTIEHLMSACAGLGLDMVFDALQGQAYPSMSWAQITNEQEESDVIDWVPQEEAEMPVTELMNEFGFEGACGADEDNVRAALRRVVDCYDGARQFNARDVASILKEIL
jgi:hypothetical protein